MHARGMYGDRSLRTSWTALTDELPELPLADDLDNMPARGEPANLHELGSTARAGDLQLVGTPAHEHVRDTSRLRLDDGPGAPRCGDCLIPRPAEKPGERHPFARERGNAPELRCRARVPQRRHQVARGFIATPARAQAAVNHFLEMIAARQRAHVLAANRARDVAAQQHHGDQADLIDVVALLPAPHPAPRDLVWNVEEIERVGGDAAAAELVRRDPEIAELELLAVTHEHIEGRQI